MRLFLTIEGCEGAGKTTAKQAVLQWLQQANIDYIETREPGGTPLAETLRQLVLSDHEETVEDTTELLMVFAARSQNLTQVIEPALAAGKVVVCDRFTDATYAYQGAGRGISIEKIAALEALVQGERRPDLTLLLDLDPEIGMARARQRAENAASQLDRIEQEEMAFFHRVRNCYLSRAEQYPEQYEIVDSSRLMVEVEGQIITILNRRLLGQ